MTTAIATTPTLEAQPLSLALDATAVTALAQSIDVRSPLTVAGFGQEIGRTAAGYADALLAEARASDIDDMGTQLNVVVAAAQSFNLDALDHGWARLPVIGPLVASLLRTKDRALSHFASLEGQIDMLIANIATTQSRLAERAATLDAIYVGVEKEHDELALHARAAEQRLCVLEVELAELRSTAEGPAASELAEAMAASMAALSKRVGDLSVLQHAALQTLPMIRMVQANNLVLIEKFATVQNLTVPAWKRAFLMALALHEQKGAVALANSIDDATNHFMRRNAEILRENAVATAKANQRMVIDVETLRDVHENVVQTLIEVRRANDEGAAKRGQAIAELGKLRLEMQNGLAAMPTMPSAQPGRLAAA